MEEGCGVLGPIAEGISVGRGGMFMPVEIPVGLGKFQCRFAFLFPLLLTVET